MAELLNKEAELIQKIEKLKGEAHDENLKRIRLKLINEVRSTFWIYTLNLKVITP